MNSHSPSVSILIPVYNTGKFLRECLESVINQTYSNLGICIINDGSTDDSPAICDEYADKENRIKYISKQNEGIGETRNRLLSMASGEFTLFVDSDDWIEPDMVESLVNIACRTQSDVVCCGMLINDAKPSGYDDVETYTREEIIKKFLLHKDLKGSLCNKLVKTSLLHNLSFDKDIHYGEDALMCWRFFNRVSRVAISCKQLYHYRMNEESVSHQSFGAKKLTGTKVWEIITAETSEHWPEYSDIAKARQGIESYYLLMQAGSGHFSKCNDIKTMQRIVTNNLTPMQNSGLLSSREILNSKIVSRWYWYASLYYRLHKIKKSF